MIEKITKEFFDIALHEFNKEENRSKFIDLVIEPTICYITDRMYPYIFITATIFILILILLLLMLVMILKKK